MDEPVDTSALPAPSASPAPPAPPATGGPHKRRRRRRGGEDKIPGEEITHLNLTPMMDIMTILLVFLVMSFATDPGNINTSLELRPPESSTKAMMEAATKVTVTAKEILVNEDVVLSLSKFAETKDEKGLLAPVRDALDEEKTKAETLASAGGKPFDGAVLVVAHETTPYEVIAAITYTAGQAQYSRLKLVTMQATGMGGGE